jgi:hypothetical protein
VERGFAIRTIATLLAAAALAVLAGTAGAAPRNPPPPRPDLQLTSATFTPRIVFKAEPKSQVRFCVEVKNVGRRRSGRIVATMTVTGPGGSAELASRSLAPLAAPTRPRRGAPLQFDSVKGCEQGESAPVQLPLGTYDVEVCVKERSGRERRTGDNCRGQAKRMFLLKRTWNATLSGTAALGVLELGFERWQSNAVVFTFDRAQQIVAKGFFGYKLSAGSVTYTDQENATGCERFGTLTDFAPTGRLSLDYLNNNYEAVGRASAGFSYPINSLCDDLQGPAMPVFLDTGIGVGRQPFAPGTERLAGTRGGPADLENYTWSFQ